MNLPPWAGYVLTLAIGLAGGGGLSTAAGGHDSATELRVMSTKLEQMSGKLDVIRAEQKASNDVGAIRGRTIDDHEVRIRQLEASKNRGN